MLRFPGFGLVSAGTIYMSPSCRASGRDRQARHPSHAEAFVHHPLARGRPRHPDGAGAARASRRHYDTDLYSGPESRPSRGPQPGRPDVRLMTMRATVQGKCVGIRCGIGAGYRAAVRVGSPARLLKEWDKTANPRRVRRPDKLHGAGGMACYPDLRIPRSNSSWADNQSATTARRD
jgi:hypothetical protein